MKDKIKIDQVASLAGISKTTISRFLNKKFDFMSAETKDRIQSVIDEVGYRPSKIAHNMKSKFSLTLGCVIADITNPVSSILVKGINDVCAGKGYTVLFANTDNDIAKEKDYVESFLDYNVDGLLINTADCDSDYLLSLQGSGLPIVLLERCLKNSSSMDSVITESRQATYNCIEYLYHQGYKLVGFFCNGLHHISSRVMRFESYVRATKKLFSYDGGEHIYYIVDDIKQSKFELMNFLNKNPETPKAIFCVNGVTLLNTLKAMYDMDIKITPELGICSFDDWGWASMIGPGITTITQDSYKVGVRSAEILIKRVEGERPYTPELIEIPNKLVKRGSTEPNIK